MSTITLPIPPKVLHPNARTRNHKYRAVMAKKARGDAHALTLASGISVEGVITIHAAWHFNQRRFSRHDDDNLTAWLKASRDGIADGLGIDDREITMGDHAQHKDAANPRVEITIEHKEQHHE